MSDLRKSSRDALNDSFDRCVNQLLRDEALRHHRLAVAAGHSGAGTSTVSTQLALALARRLSDPVVLLDANLGRPSLHATLRLEKHPGLTNLVAGELTVDKVAHHSSHYPNLSFIMVGDPVDNPSQLFASEEFGNLLAVLEDSYRVVVFDCPALGGVPESEILIERVGSAVLVLEAERTRWEIAQQVTSLMVAAGVEIAGVILNRKRRFIPDAIYRLL